MEDFNLKLNRQGNTNSTLSVTKLSQQQPSAKYTLQGFSGLSPQNLLSSSIDTVRIKFNPKDIYSFGKQLRLTGTEQEQYFINCEENFLNGEKKYLGYTKFGPKFEYWKNENKCFVEFSLPKVLYGANTFQASWGDCKDFINEWIRPYHDTSLRDKEQICINRIDYCFNFPFESKEDFNNFNQFLRTVQVGKIESNQDYTSYRSKRKNINFYNKEEDLNRSVKKPKEPKDKSDKAALEKYFEDYRNWKSSVEFASKNNIGRLEYQFKYDSIRDVCKTNYYDTVLNTMNENWFLQQFYKDFPFPRFRFCKKNKMKEIVKIINSKCNSKGASGHIEFLLYASRYGISESKDLIGSDLYRQRKTRFLKSTGFTYEQALASDEYEAFFPDQTLYQTNYEFTPDKKDYYPDMAKQYIKKG